MRFGSCRCIFRLVGLQFLRRSSGRCAYRCPHQRAFRAPNGTGQTETDEGQLLPRCHIDEGYWLKKPHCLSPKQHYTTKVQ